MRRGVESVEEGLRWVRGVVHDNERLQRRVETVEPERDRRRDEIKQPRAETERHRRERREVADHLTRVLDQVLARLRPQAA